jgi:DNA mismatch repair protein MutS2
VLGPEGERLERLLATLERQREELAGRVAEADAARDEAVREAETLRTEIERLREREDELMADAAARADAELQATLQRATRAERSARHEEGEGRSQALEEIRRLREQAQRSARPKAAARPDAAPRGVQVGARVRVPAYDADGQVVERRGERALVQLGLLKVEVGPDEVEVLADADADAAEAPAAGRRRGAPPAPAFAAGFDEEINVRGERVEQALDKIRDFVLEAQALKVARVRILHGKGTGALRDAVREYLKRERRVERFEDAVPYEGGHGVTVAYLRERT